MHSVANLATLQTPLATFFPSKKRPNLISETLWYCRASARSCSPSARTQLSLCVRLLCSAHAHTALSLSLSLSLCASAQFLSLRAHTPLSLSLCVYSVSLQRAAEEQHFNSVKHRYYVASLILHASIAKITAQLLSLSYVYLISSDDGAIIMIFLCRLTSWKGACYVGLMGHVSVTITYSFCCLTTETVKYINENSFIENLASSKYSMWAQRGKQCL